MKGLVYKGDSVQVKELDLKQLSGTGERILKKRDLQPTKRKPMPASSNNGLRSNVVRRDVAQLVAQPFHLTKDLNGTGDTPGDPHGPFIDAQIMTADAVQALQQEWDATWEARMEKAVEESYEWGYQAGEAAMRDQLEADFNRRHATMMNEIKPLQKLWETFIERAEPSLVEFTFAVVDQLLSAPLTAPLRAISERALIRALDKLKHDAPIRISLNPVDLLRLEESGLAENLKSGFPLLSWEANPDIVEGDWYLESPQKVIRHVAAELITNLQERLNLNDATPQSDLQVTVSPLPEPEEEAQADDEPDGEAPPAAPASKGSAIKDAPDFPPPPSPFPDRTADMKPPSGPSEPGDA